MRAAVVALLLAGCAPAPLPREPVDTAEVKQRLDILEARIERVEREQRALLDDMIKRRGRR